VSTDLTEPYWNNRYLENKAGWDLGEISTPLQHYIDQLEEKQLQILIPGAGNAYEAEYLHKKGFTNVFVCDIADAPLKNFSDRCSGFNTRHLLKQDFFELEENRYDLIIEQTFFCAIHPGLRQAYADKVARLLKPGGKLVGLLFNDQFETPGPPFGGTAEEYLNYFNQAFTIKALEPAYNSIKPRAGRELFINLVKAK